MLDYQEFLKEILIDEQTLQERISQLGTQISSDYSQKSLHLVCILRGGVLFLTDLMRQISIPHTIDFMAISSYGAGSRQSSGQVRLTMDLKDDIGGRDVLLVEDIVDSGHTLSSVLELLTLRKPASLKVCSLLDKFERREVDVPIDYCGFQIPDAFVFGFGLDLDEYYRDLPFIGIVNTERFQPPE
ncbi:MAG: hypoxanthine phosphoribosyltransferase [Anaerolineales bacterium]|nr:hypoxanthine phosphoribosyltransferase [Chloroflexota bacterium]MBL6982826.1 hypoxanthine phosphoribosyltransferase [Anaerolineales bacterium]